MDISTYKELNELFERVAAGYQPDVLRIHGDEITELPPEIGRLSALQELDISDTQICKLPPEIGLLTALQELDISDTQICKLPQKIGQLTALQELDISRTQISELPPEIGLLTALQELKISYTQISKLPPEIGLLTALQELDMSYTQISELPQKIGLLTSLQKLFIYCTQISELPQKIGLLTSLQELDISDTQISKLPPEICQFTALQNLTISNTQISELPQKIGQLTSLQKLDISATQIRELPPEIGKLTSLQKLDISATQINKLPPEIGLLTALQNLTISNTQISKLPLEIGQLTSLQRLDISATQIRELPPEIGLLTALQELDISYTQVSELPSVISQLSALQVVDIYRTQINELPPEIGQLTALQKLNISYTQIRELPLKLGQLTNLKQLDLSRLNLREIPSCIMKLGLNFWFEPFYLSGINLWGTTLAVQPISLFMQPRELIQAYFAAPKTTINQSKVIFLGDGGAGKTHTIMRILNGGRIADYQTETTPGIEITPFHTAAAEQQLDVNFWDFGGQVIMHSMHRCFLTGRTCYVIVIYNRYGGLERQARYWLRNIESFAAGCPVIIAVNCWDTSASDGIDTETLRREYPNLADMITYSAKCSSEAEFQRLTDAIITQARQMDSCGLKFPESWAQIRTALLEQAASTPYIDKSNYHQLCLDNGVANADIRTWLLEWFNDLGVCFSYHQDKSSNTELAEYKILSPQWLTNAIYKIINFGNKQAKLGVIMKQSMYYLLNDDRIGTMPEVKYSEQELEYILAVMRKFSLSYEIPAAANSAAAPGALNVNDNVPGQEFIPALCSAKLPADLLPAHYEKCVHYQLRYQYLPDNVVHQLMIRCYKILNPQKIWRKGLRVDVPLFKLSAIIAIDSIEENNLNIDVYSRKGQASWELLQFLREQLREINQLLNLSARDYIIMHKNEQTAVFSVNSVLKAKQKGKTELDYSFDGEYESYLISEILDDAFGSENVNASFDEAKQKDEILTADALARNSYINCSITINNIQDNHDSHDYYHSVTNGLSIEDAEALLQDILEQKDSLILKNKTDIITELLQIIAEHVDALPEELCNKMLDGLKAQNDDYVAAIIAAADSKPQNKKTKSGLFKDTLQNTANAVTIGSALSPIITKNVSILLEKIPQLVQFLSNLLS